jgi:Heterokaryon incompatibility protein (HET)
MNNEIVAKAAIECMEECEYNHSRCARRSANLLPSRVIDVGPPGQDTEPRLQINSNSETGYYACLSYCWGGTHQYMTTSATIDGHVKSFKLSSLAPTIQDTIKVTRMLQLRYLWIDALCITQDDPADKKKEMAYMGQIYKNATVTIAAARAKSVHEGFLNDWSADDARPAILPLMRHKNSIGSIKIVHADHFDTTIWPLSSRAWPLQEYLLSPRLLIFGSGGPVWQCQTQNLQPIIPSNKIFSMDLHRLPDAIFQASTESLISTPLVERPAPPPPERQKQHLTWKSIVENYSARHISVPSDRLPAITGITNELSRIWNDRCDFGIWHSNLSQQLVWYVETRQQEGNSMPGVPSWSWLRVNTSIKHLDYIPKLDLPKRPPLSESSRFHPIGFGRVKDGHLVVDETDFMPANEMTKEERRQVFDAVSRDHKFQSKWLKECIEEGARYDLVGPLAAFMDFDRDGEIEAKDDIPKLESDVEVGISKKDNTSRNIENLEEDENSEEDKSSVEDETSEGYETTEEDYLAELEELAAAKDVKRPPWFHEVAYLTLGYLVGTHHDLGTYIPSLRQSPASS